MASAPIARAKRFATARLVKVLREQYASVLEVERVAAGIRLQPCPPRYAIAATSPTDPEDLTLNAPTMLFVWPDTGRSVSSRTSEGMTTYDASTRVDLDVVCLFRAVPQDFPAALAPPGGSVPTDSEQLALDVELMRLRADVYGGAIIETVLRYAQDAYSVHDITLLSDASTPIFADGRPTFGVAAARFTVTQRVAMPNKTPLP